MRSTNNYYRRGNRRRNAFGSAATFVSLIVLAAIFGYMSDQEVQLTWGKLKAGDRIYADSLKLQKDTADYGVSFCRRIRPINASDINKKHIPQWKKLKLISQLDTTAKHNVSRMISSEIRTRQDSMFKRGTALLGIYIKSDSTSMKYYSDGSGSPEKWYAIKPGPGVLHYSNFTIPKGYVLADKYYYIDAHDARSEEPTIFKNHNRSVAQLTPTGSVKVGKPKLPRKSDSNW